MKFKRGQEVAINADSGAGIMPRLRGKRATFHAYVETYDGSGVDCMVHFATPRGRRKLFCGCSADLVLVNR